MVQRTEITTYDDVDWREKGQQNPATIRQVVIDGQRFEIDLTPDNAAEFLEPLRDLLTKYGREVKGEPLPPYTCEHPGCGERFEHGTSRAAHYRKDHPNWTPPGKVTATAKPSANGTAGARPRKRAAKKAASSST